MSVLQLTQCWRCLWNTIPWMVNHVRLIAYYVPFLVLSTFIFFWGGTYAFLRNFKMCFFLFYSYINTRTIICVLTFVSIYDLHKAVTFCMSCIKSINNTLNEPCEIVIWYILLYFCSDILNFSLLLTDRNCSRSCDQGAKPGRVFL